MIRRQNLLNKFVLFLTDYGLLTFSLIVLFLVIRSLEFIYIENQLDIKISSGLFLSRSVKYDTISVLIYAAITVIPLALLSLLHLRTAKITARILAFFLILLNLTFTQFFLTNNALLTSVLLEFSLEEIVSIVSNEVTTNRTPFWVGVISVLICSGLLFYLSGKGAKFKRRYQIITICIFTSILIIGVSTLNHTYKSQNHFKSKYEYQLGNSKIVFFVRSYFNNIGNNNINLADARIQSKHFHNLFNHFNFTDSDYPLIHDEPYQNVLGPFFQQSDSAPNIVLIISESLSMSYSGPDNTIGGSLTPFLDSLASQGLLWTKFLSNVQRSFGALPNILGSLPFGSSERGFINMNHTGLFNKRYPTHTSLIQLLKYNGYETNYFYGGWKNFDKMGYFITANGVDHLVSDENFDTSKYIKPVRTEKRMVWGYGDKDLYNQSLDYIKTYDTIKPYLNIYQTLSMHSPFNLSEDRYFDYKYVQERLKGMDLPPNEILKKIKHRVVGSILFADDALREYFKKIQSDPRFKNTIFVITGDHAIGLHICDHAFEYYHVPLLIYSPLLKERNIEFKGLCSHIDILPSLIALLKDNYHLSFPESKHWVGTGLDTSRQFNANRFVPLNITSPAIPGIAYKNNLILDGNVLKFDKDFNTKPEDEPQKIRTIQTLFETYKYINTLVCIDDKIWHYPDSTINNIYLKQK